MATSSRKDTASRSNGRITQEESTSVLDKLLKGKNLSVAFNDYQQWERRRSPPLHSAERRSRKTVHVQLPPTGSFQFPRPGGSRLIRGRKEEGQKRSTTSAAEIRVLKALIATRKQSLAEYLKHQKELIRCNVALKDHITSSEVDTHSDVRELLQKYERFRGAVSVIEQRFEKELATTRKQLDVTSTTVTKELQDLEQQLQRLERIVKAKKDDMSFLNTYKDKVFPVKARRIAELRQQLDSLTVSQKVSTDELKMVISKERQRCDHKEQTRKIKIEQLTAVAALETMQPVTKLQAIQNRVMEKEIQMHRTEVEQLRQDTKRLEIENKLLQQEIKVMARLPQQQEQQEKCLPTADIKLNIPQQEWLPV